MQMWRRTLYHTTARSRKWISRTREYLGGAAFEWSLCILAASSLLMKLSKISTLQIQLILDQLSSLQTTQHKEVGELDVARSIQCLPLSSEHICLLPCKSPQWGIAARNKQSAADLGRRQHCLNPKTCPRNCNPCSENSGHIFLLRMNVLIIEGAVAFALQHCCVDKTADTCAGCHLPHLQWQFLPVELL